MASFADPSSPINPLNWEFPPSILFLPFSLLSVYYPRAKSSTRMCSVTIYKLPWTQILPPEAPPELQGEVSTACRMFPSACPKVKPKVLIFLFLLLYLPSPSVSTTSKTKSLPCVGPAGCCHSHYLVFPYLHAPNTGTHVHTHACTRAPHVIGQEACVTFLCCPVW